MEKLKKPTFLTVTLTSILACSCSLPAHMDVAGQTVQKQGPLKPVSGVPARGQEDWLAEQKIEKALIKQQLEAKSEAEQIQQLRTLQQQAQISLDLCDSAHLKLVKSSVLNGLPEGMFPVSDLKKYLDRVKDPKSIELVLVMLPSGDLPYEEGKTNLCATIRSIDHTLQNAGAKRRVFGFMHQLHFYRLDSAEPN